jgi:hypothetical protein
MSVGCHAGRSESTGSSDIHLAVENLGEYNLDHCLLMDT